MRSPQVQMFEYPVCLLCALVFAGLAVGASLGQSSTRSAKVGGMAHEGPPLEVTLRTDRDSYKLGDEIIVRVLLTNKSRSPLYIYAPLECGESASISIWLKDALSGKDAPEYFISDAVTPPPGSKDDFIKLLPDHVFGVVFTSTMKDFNVRQKGTYEVTAEYHSPIPASMNFGLPIWSREKGAVSSNRVTLTVGE
jgi:hypothetical protein